MFNNEWIDDPTVQVNGFDLPRKLWVQLNRIRTAYGRCNAFLYKLKVSGSPKFDCGATEQTIPHIVLFDTLIEFIRRFVVLHLLDQRIGC